MTPEREAELEHEELRKFFLFCVILVSIIAAIAAELKLMEYAHLKGYQERIAAENRYEVMRNACIDWAHDNRANAAMIKDAVK